MKRYRKTFTPEAMQITEDNKDLSYKMGEGLRDYWMVSNGLLIYSDDNSIREPLYGPGDWLVKGINGDIYPVSDEVFRKTYEELSD